MNEYEACAIHILNHPSKFIPYIYCLEEGNTTIEAAKKCADNSGVSISSELIGYNCKVRFPVRFVYLFRI